MDVDELQRLGLYDPTAPDADDQLAIVRYLLDVGVPAERLAGVRGAGAWREVLLEYRLFGDAPRRSIRDVADQLGADPAVLAEAATAAGLPIVDPDAPIMTPDECEAIGSFVAAEQLFGREAVLRLTRVVATSLATITEAAVSVFNLNVEDPLLAKGGTEADVTRAADEALAVLGAVPELFAKLFRRHALNASRRLSAAHPPQSTHDQLALTVGFADLVGSTVWTQSQGPRELAAALGEFERLAHQSLRGEARVVKTIGDEVMFVTLDPADACRTGLALAEAVEGEPSLPQLRVGVARGLVAALDGDFYGEEVNRAARLVRLGDAGQVTVSSTVAEAAGAAPDLAFVPLGARTLVGFAEPAEVLAVTWGDPNATAIGSGLVTRPRPGRSEPLC